MLLIQFITRWCWLCRW